MWPAIDAKKIKNRKLPKNDKLHFVRITLSYFCGVALNFQTPNHQSPVSDAEFTFDLSLKATKSTANQKSTEGKLAVGRETCVGFL